MTPPHYTSYTHWREDTICHAIGNDHMDIRLAMGLSSPHPILTLSCGICESRRVIHAKYLPKGGLKNKLRIESSRRTFLDELQLEVIQRIRGNYMSFWDRLLLE